MKRTSILPLLTLVLTLFVAITQSTAQTTDDNAVAVSAYSVEPTALNKFIANKDEYGNYNLVDPKPVLRVLFEGCDRIEYHDELIVGDSEGEDVDSNTTSVVALTEDWYESVMADTPTYPYHVKLFLHNNCYITYANGTKRVSLAIDDPEIDKEKHQIIFKFITSDLEYIPSGTTFQLHLPKFKYFVEETEGEDATEITDVTYTVASSEVTDDEIVFEFKTKDCNVVSGGTELYTSTDANSTPLIVCDKSDYIIDSKRECSQLIVEPGSGIRIKSDGELIVADTAYFIGPDTYDLTLRPYLINSGIFDNDNSSEVKDDETEDEVVGRTVFTQNITMTGNDLFFRKFRFALPIEKCIASSMSTYIDEVANLQIISEYYENGSVDEYSVSLRSYKQNNNDDHIFCYDEENEGNINLISRISSQSIDEEYNRKAILRLNGKINDSFEYDFVNKSKYNYSSNEYRLICARHSVNNVLQAPLDMRRIYEDERTDAYSMWISYGKNFDAFAYNCISGITTFDGDMREGYLLPQMSYFFADHNTNYDYTGDSKLSIHFQYNKDDLKTYDDIIETYKKYDTDDIDVDYKYYRFYVEEKNPDSPDFGNRYVFAVYFMPKEDYDAKVKPYRLGQTANGMPSGSNVTDGHMNPVYECMIDCDGNYVYSGDYTSNTPKYFHFPVITASSYNGYDVAGIYSSTYGDGAGYYDYQRGLIIKCLPEPQPCNVGNTEEPHDHSETIKETVVVTDDDGEPVIDDEGNEITREVDTGNKVCSYQALDLPLIIRANDITSKVELGILDTNITEEDGITLEDAETNDEKINISEKLLSGETYEIEFKEAKTQIFLNHYDSYNSVLVPYTIIKLKFVPNPEYSSEYVMPDDPDLGGGSTGSEDLDPNASGGSAGSDGGEGGSGSETGGGSGSGSGETTTTPEAISTVQTSTVSVVAKQSAVEVRGTQPGAVCAIYDLTGAQVAQKTSAGSTVTLQVPKAGIYFIAVAQDNTTKTFKTIVK